MQFLRHILILLSIMFCLGASTMQIATFQTIPPAQPEAPTPLPEELARHAFTITARRISQEVFGKLRLEGDASVTITTDDGSFMLQGDLIECLLDHIGMSDITANGHAVFTNPEEGATLEGNSIHMDLLTDDITVEGFY